MKPIYYAVTVKEAGSRKPQLSMGKIRIPWET